MPAFFEEWALTIAEPKDIEAEATLLVARKKVFNRNKYRSPAVESVVGRIDANTARTMRRILERMLLETRPCQQLDGFIGMDGETYSMSAFVLNRGVLSGEVWSPKSDTRAGRLVASVTLVYKLVGATPAEQVVLREQLDSQVRELSREVLGEGD